MSKLGGMVINATDLGWPPDDTLQPGLHVTVANHGNAPAFNVEFHLWAAGDRSAISLAVGELLALRKPQLPAGEEATFILADDLKFGSAVKGLGRWEGIDVWGRGVEKPDRTTLRGALTWREPPRLKKERRRNVEHPRAELSTWF